MLAAARFLPPASVTAPTHGAACRIWDFLADTNVDEMELKDTERGGMGSKHSQDWGLEVGRGVGGGGGGEGEVLKELTILKTRFCPARTATKTELWNYSTHTRACARALARTKTHTNTHTHTHTHTHLSLIHI